MTGDAHPHGPLRAIPPSDPLPREEFRKCREVIVRIDPDQPPYTIIGTDLWDIIRKFEVMMGAEVTCVVQLHTTSRSGGRAWSINMGEKASNGSNTPIEKYVLRESF